MAFPLTCHLCHLREDDLGRSWPLHEPWAGSPNSSSVPPFQRSASAMSDWKQLRWRPDRPCGPCGSCPRAVLWNNACRRDPSLPRSPCTPLNDTVGHPFQASAQCCKWSCPVQCLATDVSSREAAGCPNSFQPHGRFHFGTGRISPPALALFHPMPANSCTASWSSPA